MSEGAVHQSQIAPEENKFHKGNGDDGKHYWLTPPDVLAKLSTEFGPFDFDPCPYPLPPGFDGLTCEWGERNYVNPPFGSIVHQGRKKGPTAWVRKSIEEWQRGKLVVLVYPVDKWILMLLKAILGDHAEVRNLGDVRWLATEDGSAGNGTGRHIACFVLKPLSLVEVFRREAEIPTRAKGALSLCVEALDALTDKVDRTGFAQSDEFAQALDALDIGKAALGTSSASFNNTPAWSL